MDFPHQRYVSQPVWFLAHDGRCHMLQVEGECIAPKRLKSFSNRWAAVSFQTPETSIRGRKIAEIPEISSRGAEYRRIPVRGLGMRYGVDDGPGGRAVSLQANMVPIDDASLVQQINR